MLKKIILGSLVMVMVAGLSLVPQRAAWAQDYGLRDAISFQGMLMGENRVSVNDDAAEIIFKIYDMETNTLLFTQSHDGNYAPTLPVKDGFFSTVLIANDTGERLPPLVLTKGYKNLELGIIYKGTEKKQPLTGVPYQGVGAGGEVQNPMFLDVGLIPADFPLTAQLRVKNEGRVIAIHAKGGLTGIRAESPLLAINAESPVTAILADGKTEGVGISAKGKIGLKAVGINKGVESTSTSMDKDGGAGVYGYGPAGVEGEGLYVGVKGEATRVDGVGVLGKGQQIGVQGESDRWAVYGDGGETGIGVYGKGKIGVYATGSENALKAETAYNPDIYTALILNKYTNPNKPGSDVFKKALFVKGDIFVTGRVISLHDNMKVKRVSEYDEMVEEDHPVRKVTSKFVYDPEIDQQTRTKISDENIDWYFKVFYIEQDETMPGSDLYASHELKTPDNMSIRAGDTFTFNEFEMYHQDSFYCFEIDGERELSDGRILEWEPEYVERSVPPTRPIIFTLRVRPAPPTVAGGVGITSTFGGLFGAVSNAAELRAKETGGIGTTVFVGADFNYTDSSGAIQQAKKGYILGFNEFSDANWYPIVGKFRGPQIATNAVTDRIIAANAVTIDKIGGDAKWQIINALNLDDIEGGLKFDAFTKTLQFNGVQLGDPITLITPPAVGGVVSWLDVQDKPVLVTHDNVNSMVVSVFDDNLTKDKLTGILDLGGLAFKDKVSWTKISGKPTIPSLPAGTILTTKNYGSYVRYDKIKYIPNLSTYATTNSLKNYATTNSLTNSLKNYATKSSVTTINSKLAKFDADLVKINDNFTVIKGQIPNFTPKIIYFPSSLRYKKDIKPLKDDFSLILKAEPKSFKYKDTGKPDIGYIAEEFDTLGLKDLVVYDDQGRPDQLKYHLISVYLLETIKDMRAKDAELEARIQALEDKAGQ